MRLDPIVQEKRPHPHKVNMTSLEKTVAQAHEFLTCLLLRMGPDSPEFVAAAQAQENDILTCIASMSSIGIEIITRVLTDINKGPFRAEFQTLVTTSILSNQRMKTSVHEGRTKLQKTSLPGKLPHGRGLVQYSVGQPDVLEQSKCHHSSATVDRTEHSKRDNARAHCSVDVLCHQSALPCQREPSHGACYGEGRQGFVQVMELQGGLFHV